MGVSHLRERIMAIKIGMFLETPSVPNFVRIKGTDRAYPISEMSIDELRGLGKQWTEALILKSRKNKKS